MITEFQNTQCAVRGTHDEMGFSLTEVLLAVITLSVGMLFIAGVFPVSISFTTVASERTIAANAADEAFAKIKLYGLLTFTDPNWNAIGQTPFEVVSSTSVPTVEFAYPSTPTADPNSKKYWWSAICRRISPAEVQVTVFISRKAGVTSRYSGFDPGRPDPIAVSSTPVPPVPTYDLSVPSNSKISDGYTIVSDADGQIYRVVGRTDRPSDIVIHLDKPWQGLVTGGPIWFVQPPGMGTPFVPNGRYPCIAVYQKIIRF